MYIYIHIYMYIHIYTCIHIYPFFNINIHMHTHVYIHMYVDTEIDSMCLTHTCTHRPPLRVCAKERESVSSCTCFSVCVCVREGLEERDGWGRVCESLTYWYVREILEALTHYWYVREIVEALTHCVLADSRLSHTYCFTYIVVCEHSALAVSLLLA